MNLMIYKNLKVKEENKGNWEIKNWKIKEIGK